nr:hypothetical protein [Flavobacterium covae]
MNHIKSQLKKIVLLNALILILFSSCNEKKKEEADETKSENEIALTKTQYKTIGIETGKIESKNLNSAIKASGYTTVPPTKQSQRIHLDKWSGKRYLCFRRYLCNKRKNSRNYSKLRSN